MKSARNCAAGPIAVLKVDSDLVRAEVLERHGSQQRPGDPALRILLKKKCAPFIHPTQRYARRSGYLHLRCVSLGHYGRLEAHERAHGDVELPRLERKVTHWGKLHRVRFA